MSARMTWRRGGTEDLEYLGQVRHLDVPRLVHQETAAFTVDGEVVAMWGLMQRWAGVADLWGVVDHDKVRGRQALTFTRLSRRLLNAASYGLRLGRVTAFVEADIPEYRRFAAGAGFELEASLHGAGPDGTDLLVYVRYFKWATSSAASSAAVSRNPQPRPSLRLITGRSGATTGSGPETRSSATTPT